MNVRKSPHRIERRSSPTLGLRRGSAPSHHGEPLKENAWLDCGWGRLIFGQTFSSNEELVAAIREEADGQRDLALYLRDPHVVVALAPQELFLDPSHTYRLWLSAYLPGRTRPEAFTIRRLQSRADAEGIQRLLLSRGMVSPDPEFIWSKRGDREFQFLVAEDPEGRLIGTVMGVDHAEAFDDPENGSSMWCLAVDPQARQPGIGRSLVARIADCFAGRGRAYMDLSVMHDNTAVIRLYESMGFERIPAFCVKRKNAINESLYVGPRPESGLNPYAQIIVDEALKRGIGVEVRHAEFGIFALNFGGRTIVCRESLSELTTAVAMTCCDDKRLTRRIALQAGLRVPRQQAAGDPDGNAAFLETCGRLVVKPARGEQGRGISVNLGTPDEVQAAVAEAGRHGDALLEEYVTGQDLRIVLIDYRVVAAAIRRPAEVVGNGRHTITGLIEKQSRRRAAATGGESRIPLDAETRRCVQRQGYDMDAILPRGETLAVRETANLHTGGTLHDVTAELHPELRSAAERCAKALSIPVVGLDLIVDGPDQPGYVLIEANERPGLANHEPQPTAERFMDLLFPQTAAA